MNLILDNITIFTNNTNSDILHDHVVIISGNKIAAIQERQSISEEYQQYQKFDGGGRLLMPGLVNGHMHFYSTYARGISLPDAPQGFSEILKKMWWKLDSVLDNDAIYYSALVPSITAIKSGVTSVIDHHASPQAVDGSLDLIESAVGKVGLRAALCYEISDRDGKEICKKGLDENERYIKKCLKKDEIDPSNPYSGMVGLHASFTLENDTLEAAGNLISLHGQGGHIHVSEAQDDIVATQEKFGSGVIERLLHFGILGDRSLAAHCIHLTEEEKSLLADSGTMVVHNPQSNMNNAVGRTDLAGLLRRDIKLGLGTDGMTPDITTDLKTAIWLQKHDLKDNNAAFMDLEQMVMQNNPAIMSRIGGKSLGRIEAGYLADMILIDYDPPTPMDKNNFWGHFVFGICDVAVNTSIINGKIVMQDKKLVGIDEGEIYSKSREIARQVWQKFSQ
ncbi:MAG: putative aminohydrolase SsnA [Proteobacteria bacterium]|nr:putative aminohydrolase SsnA [Pseudomonadota bacterium]